MNCKPFDKSTLLSVDKSISQNPLLSSNPDSWTTNPMHFELHEHEVSHSVHFRLNNVEDMVNSPIVLSTSFSMISPSLFVHLPEPICL